MHYSLYPYVFSLLRETDQDSVLAHEKTIERCNRRTFWAMISTVAAVFLVFGLSKHTSLMFTGISLAVVAAAGATVILICKMYGSTSEDIVKGICKSVYDNLSQPRKASLVDFHKRGDGEGILKEFRKHLNPDVDHLVIYHEAEKNPRSAYFLLYDSKDRLIEYILHCPQSDMEFMRWDRNMTETFDGQPTPEQYQALITMRSYVLTYSNSEHLAF